MTTEKIIREFEEAYVQSAKNLENVREEINSISSSVDKKRFVTLKYMATIVYNDLSREYCNIYKNKTTGTSKILALGPLILKLFEAHNWYKTEGNKKLLSLAKSRNVDKDVNKKLKKLKSIKPNRIETYSSFRNRLAGHYSTDSIVLINELESLEEEKFFDDIASVIQYGNGWLKILKFVGDPTTL